MRNNKGFSLIELLVSVAILSIVMAGVAAVMVSMSKTFSDSQREVALQDSVQSTYNIISEIVKEAHTNSSAPEIEKDENDVNKTYIFVENTVDSNLSKAFLISKRGKKLYLYEGTPSNIKSMSESDKEAHLLATNISDFDINTDTMIKDGYVIMKLECENGNRKADIVQNVYLRNSNKSAEWDSGGNTNSNDPFKDGYVIKSLTSNRSCKITTFYEGDAAGANDFRIEAVWVKSDGTGSQKTANIPGKYLTCSDFDKPVNEVGSKKYTINVTSTSIIASPEIRGNNEELFPVDISVSVVKRPEVDKDPSLVNKNLSTPNITQILDDSTEHIDYGDIKVYYNSGAKTKTENQDVPIYEYVCPTCESAVGQTSDMASAGRYYCTNGSCIHGKEQWWHSNNIMKDDLKQKVTGHTNKPVTVVTGNKGYLTIRNESDKPFSDVLVYVYFEEDDKYFIPVTGTKYLTTDESNVGTQKISYETSVANGDKVKYIRIYFPKLFGYKEDASKQKVYDSYTFNYNWNGTGGSPAITTFVIEGGKPAPST